jgi:cyclophilin family peptidyl-prolyl cis-trans isomerase
MGTEKRQRQKEGRQARLAAEQTDQRRRQQRRRLVSAVVISLVVFAVLVLISQAGTDDEADTAAQATNTTLTEPEPDAGLTTTTPAAPAAFEYGTGECPPAEKPAELVRSFSAAPQRCIEDGVDYAAVLSTSQGAFTVDLLEDEAPGTVNNFVVLARYGYYEGAPFHRVIADFVVQGGDPVGDPPGTGGPGYTIPDELPAAGSYQVGSMAMANSFNGQVGRNSGGSQFFVVTGEEGVALPPNYSLFGTVVEGAEVVDLLEATAEEGTQTPTDPATIESVEIVEQ